MPELPEVETIKNDLQAEIVGAKILDINFLWPKIFQGDDIDKAKQKIIGEKIIGVTRRAKNLAIALSNNYHLLLHMKMTGHLLVEPDTKKVDKHGNWEAQEGQLKDSFNQYIRAIFWLDNNKILAFSDLRKFGYIKLLSADELKNFFDSYGPEPFSKNFNKEYLSKVFSSKKTAIKKVLTDQNIIAGIGNIYADEILWKTKIHPLTKANKLTDKEIEAIIKKTREILTCAINNRGTSTSDFRDTKGAKGSYGNKLAVYKRNGQQCPRDGVIIEKIKIGGRGTHFCPKEQKVRT